MNAGLPLTQNVADDDTQLIEAIKRHDEAAFVTLVERYQATLLRIALVYAGNRALAEDVVQDAWVGVLAGIAKFEGRSSFKTWLFRILVNRARSRAVREDRTVPFSALGDGSFQSQAPAVPPHRFCGSDSEWADHWSVPPNAWGSSPEEELIARETQDLISRELVRLPPAQREVITLRDVNGWSAEEVCNVLGLTETNQRVLLHRARSRVRAVLESYLDSK
jgi:RNA polymerase sigma-70 factor (ECF subfamily)